MQILSSGSTGSSGSTSLTFMRWPWIVAGMVLLLLLNQLPAVHHAIISLDRAVAVRANSLLGRSPAFDRQLGRLNTRAGDVFVLALICLVFLVHALRGADSKEILRRLTFWGWTGLLCLATYALQSESEYLIKRKIPILELDQLKNLHAMYGIPLRTGGGSSFPSGHGLAYIFFALMAWRRGYLGVSLALWGLAVLMPGLRLVIGVHWLSDVVLGSLPLAALIAALAWETRLRKTYILMGKAVLLFAVQIWGCHWPFKFTRRLAPSPHH